jgi:hypothetical protein
MRENTSSDSAQNQSQSQPDFGDPQLDWRDMRRQERAEWRAARRQWRGNNGWIGGGILILLGVIFLLQNAGIFFVQNWWAVFILIPALGSLWTAYTLYRNTGEVGSPPFLGSLVIGTLLLLLALGLLFGIDAGFFLPVAMILGGIAVLASGILNPRR